MFSATHHFSKKKRGTGIKSPHLHIAIPALDEMDFLPLTLDAIATSKFPRLTPTDCHSQPHQNATDKCQQATSSLPQELPYSVYVCVNQPDEWWDDPQRRTICEHNASLLHLLGKYPNFPITLLDFSSKGRGWKGKDYGVGWARKKLFEHILSVADDNDLVVSMDADTQFGPLYLDSLTQNFARHPNWKALSAPYFHRLTGDDVADRAILRYEIYMRSFALNMLLIESPYSFTAIGSAIVVRASALRKIGGITPAKSGEDFYLLQKLTKMGAVGSWNEFPVYPAARYSDRVIFGTGPAMLKGAAGEWDSYPIYPFPLFQKIHETYKRIDELYEHDLESEFLSFLQQQFKQTDLWSSIRRNVKDAVQFRRAFHEKADGLRILQFLKKEQKERSSTDLQALNNNLKFFLTNQKCCQALSDSDKVALSNICSFSSFDTIPTSTLSFLREAMRKMEMALRKEND